MGSCLSATHHLPAFIFCVLCPCFLHFVQSFLLLSKGKKNYKDIALPQQNGNSILFY